MSTELALWQPPDPRTRVSKANAHALMTSEVVEALVGRHASMRELRVCETAIHRWRASGHITPSIRMTTGSGSHVLWSEDDLDRLRKIWMLRTQFHSTSMNLPPQIVAEIWQSLAAGERWTMQIEIDNHGVTAIGAVS